MASSCVTGVNSYLDLTWTFATCHKPVQKNYEESGKYSLGWPFLLEILIGYSIVYSSSGWIKSSCRVGWMLCRHIDSLGWQLNKKRKEWVGAFISLGCKLHLVSAVFLLLLQDFCLHMTMEYKRLIAASCILNFSYQSSHCWILWAKPAQYFFLEFINDRFRNYSFSVKRRK